MISFSFRYSFLRVICMRGPRSNLDRQRTVALDAPPLKVESLELSLLSGFERLERNARSPAAQAKRAPSAVTDSCRTLVLARAVTARADLEPFLVARFLRDADEAPDKYVRAHEKPGDATGPGVFCHLRISGVDCFDKALARLGKMSELGPELHRRATYLCHLASPPSALVGCAAPVLSSRFHARCISIARSYTRSSNLLMKSSLVSMVKEFFHSLCSCSPSG
jgi:hypothetical protein